VYFATLDEINDESLGLTERYGRTNMAVILLAKYGLAGRDIRENEDDIPARFVHIWAVSFPLAIV
jgi:hypothetical protein